MLFDKPVGSRCIILEGNIGAGKSTLLSIIQSLENVGIVYEPVELWQKVGGSNNLLEAFYNNPHRWSYTFQSYAFLTRVLAAERALGSSNNPFYILERSVYSDRYCFAKNALESGLMSPLEWAVYTEWFDWLVVENTFFPDGFIYMRTTPSTCFKRISQRNRIEEHTIQYTYLEQLHNKHEEWLVTKKDCPDYLKGVPVAIIDCNEEFEQDRVYQKSILEQIKSFIKQLS